MPIGLFIIPALGLGGTTQLSFIIAQYCIPQEKLGLAMGIINTARSLGGSIGVAICGAILNSELNKHLIKNELSALLASGATLAQIPAIAEALETGVAADLIAAAGGNMAIVLAASDALKKTYGDAFRYVCIVYVAPTYVNFKLVLCFCRHYHLALLGWPARVFSKRLQSICQQILFLALNKIKLKNFKLIQLKSQVESI